MIITLPDDRIVRKLDDVDFGIIDDFIDDPDPDEWLIKLKTVHGTVYWVKGLFEDAPDEIVPVGYVDGEEEGHLAFCNDEFLREDKADGDA